jgi:pimeloyl-ACP methyl ester carboxylesterase
MSTPAQPFEIDTEWVHIAYREKTGFTETYGFAGSQGLVNLEGLRLRPRGRPSDTLLVYMHPSSTLQLLPVPREAVARGAHVLCAGSRYARNDSALILEKVLLDLGAYVHHAKAVWGYRHVVLVGWSGGGSLALFYQAQAERPTITHTPAGDRVDLVGAGLLPADAVVFQSAHLSRARLLLDLLDASVVDELDPDRRDPALDLYDRANPNQPPYAADFVAAVRAAQRARMERIDAWVRDTLAMLARRGGDELERGFVVHRTLADPRFLDPALDPNGRRPRWCYLGNPETVNTGPVGLARFCTLRSWLSQWSLAHTRGDALANAPQIRAPLLVIENGADDAVPQPHPRQVFDAATTADKSFHVIAGANHYYAGQPAQLAEATTTLLDWLAARGMAGR